MGLTIFRICLIIADAFCIAIADSKVTKVLGVVGITLMSISFLGR